MKNVVETDILIVGGGPAGFAAAIHLTDLVAKYNETAAEKIVPRILLLEKANAVGNHTLSGAVINPGPFR